MSDYTVEHDDRHAVEAAAEQGRVLGQAVARGAARGQAVRAGVERLHGPRRLLRRIYDGVCLRVDPTAQRATFACGEVLPDGELAGVRYWPRAPRVGEALPVFEAEGQLLWCEPFAAAETLWLYWLAAVSDGAVSLYRARWPAEDVPTLEHVADIPIAAEIDRVYLVGIDGQGTVYLALDHFAIASGDGRSYTQTIPDWGHGAPQAPIHVLWVDPAGTDHTDAPTGSSTVYSALVPIALASTAAGAGVLVGALDLYEPLPPNPPFTAQLSPSYRRYFRSDDGGSTWHEFARHLHEVDAWNNPGVNGSVLRALYYSPGSTAWATVTEADEQPHDVAAGTLVLRQSLYRHDSTPFVSGPGGAKIGFGIADEAGTITTVDLGGDFWDANLALAGITSERLREIVSWQTLVAGDFGPTATYRSDADAATPWELLDVTSVPPGIPFGFAHDRALLHGIGVDADFFFVYTTDGGDTWQRFSADQAPLRDALAFALVLPGAQLIVQAPD